MRKPRAAAPKLHLGYVRVSTEEQSTKGVSLADQQSRVRKYSEAREIELAEVIVDAGASAKDLNRKGMQRLLGMIRRGQVASVTVTKLDRITRSMRDLGDLLDLSQRYGFALVSVGESLDTSTAAGRMVVNMLGVVAQWERETISERTSYAMAHKRRQGEFCGGKRAPYGFRAVAGNVIPHKGEQHILAGIVEQRQEGVSLRRIVDDLNERGIPGPQGGVWHLSGLVSVLKSKTTAEAA